MQIDETDQQIIASLVEDARASYAEIGTRVALSAPAVKRRVDRLRAGKVIRGYTAIIDPAALVHLRAADISGLEQALERLRAEPFVTSTRSLIVLSRLVESAPAPPSG